MNRTRLRGAAAVAAAVTTGGLVFGAAASGSFVTAGPVAAGPAAAGTDARSGLDLALAIEDTRAELRVSRGDLRNPLVPTEVLAVRVVAPEPPAAAPPPAPPVPTDPRSIARAMLADRDWSDQWSCLNKLWERESNWKTHEANPHSEAYGIPQALPGYRMASEGADWEDNPATQIRWGLKYIAGRYGSPCAAYEHSNSYNWY